MKHFEIHVEIQNKEYPARKWILVAFSQRLPEKRNDKNFGREEGTPIYGQESGCVC